MRGGVDLKKLQTFMEELGNTARGPGRVYIVGGSTALLLGIREMTIDVDIKLDPEPLGVFESIARLKEQLSINVELASPDQFIPAIRGWQERSEFIARYGQVEFCHYDFYGQALAKIQRNYANDVEDARALIRLGKVDRSRLGDYFEEIKPELIRYPQINIKEIQRRVVDFLRSGE